jgi:hypothetical protein
MRSGGSFTVAAFRQNAAIILKEFLRRSTEAPLRPPP